MLEGKKIAIIGAGNMAEALVSGLLKQGVVSPERLVATDVDSQRLAHFRTTFGIQVGRDNQKAAQSSDIILLAVKPQVMDEVLRGLKVSPDFSQLIVTVAAGISIATIMAGLSPHTRVVRAMPNTASVVLEGATALAGGPGVTEEQMQIAQAMFEAVGHVVVVKESHLDAVTGLSGGGVAYVYTFIEALADGGVKMGLSRSHAQLLAAQTVLGAAKMVRETNEHPGVLKDRVASPGGATMAGLHQLEQGRLRGTVIGAVESATIRSNVLGQQACEVRASSPATSSVKHAASRR
ncbi:MAG: pyrroline-5-carboxylate reductase [Nitrospira sp.]|nr:pyrroline-5-carboxylate reductase [Nitrospira sp.]